MRTWIVVGLLLSALAACAPYPYYGDGYGGTYRDGYYHGGYSDRPYYRGYGDGYYRGDPD